MSHPSTHQRGPFWGVLALSAVLSCGLFFYFQHGQAGQAGEELVPLLVATRQIKPDSQLKSDDVRIRHIPKPFFPLGGLEHPSQAVGRVNRTELFPGDPLLEGKFYQDGELRLMAPAGR